MAVIYKLKKYKNKSSDFNNYVYACVATIENPQKAGGACGT